MKQLFTFFTYIFIFKSKLTNYQKDCCNYFHAAINGTLLNKTLFTFRMFEVFINVSLNQVVLSPIFHNQNARAAIKGTTAKTCFFRTYIFLYSVHSRFAHAPTSTTLGDGNRKLSRRKMVS